MTERCPLGGCILRVASGDEGTSSYVVVRPAIDAEADEAVFDKWFEIIGATPNPTWTVEEYCEMAWFDALAYARRTTVMEGQRE